MPDTHRLVETWYETYGRHDLDGLLAMLDDDVRIYFPVDDKPKTGKDQIRPAWSLSFSTVIPDIRQELLLYLHQPGPDPRDPLLLGHRELRPAARHRHVWGMSPCSA